MSLNQLSIQEFNEQLSTKAPVPGGGGTSALVGALAASLGSMVANLTIGKKRYAEYEERVMELCKQAILLRDVMLELVEEDAIVFEPLSKAYGLPKTTKEEIAYKEKVMEEALFAASKVPFEIVKKMTEIIDIHEELAMKGSKIAISDVGVGAALAKAGMESAALNVYINTKLMKNREVAIQMNQEMDEALAFYTLKAESIYHMVRNSLVGEN